MPRQDFVEEMQNILGKQNEKDRREKQAKLHRAQVIASQAGPKWTELRNETRNTVEQIGEGLLYTDTSDAEFTITAQSRVMRVSVDLPAAIISYGCGAKSGAFKPAIKGNDLEFIREYKMPSGEIIVDDVSGGTFKPREISEILISEVVGSTQ